jgi:uncharacterized protein (DUF983 family)
MNENYYQDFSPFQTGMRGKCPRCGRGKLFSGYLTVAKSCANCGLSFSFADAGDGAAWFVTLFACIFGVGGILGIEIGYSPPIWVHVLVGSVFLVLLPMLLLRPVKGLLLAQQWKTNAHEGELK